MHFSFCNLDKESQINFEDWFLYLVGIVSFKMNEREGGCGNFLVLRWRFNIWDLWVFSTWKWLHDSICTSSKMHSTPTCTWILTNIFTPESGTLSMHDLLNYPKIFWCEFEWEHFKCRRATVIHGKSRMVFNKSYFKVFLTRFKYSAHSRTPSRSYWIYSTMK